ncbi:MAG: hypothetical protein JNK64_34355 [Myxococcales bacterium]|nr:hypothetical protein [Myxococcales bacterium]
MAQPSRRVLPYILGLLVCLAAVAMARRGWSFYGLSLEDRVEHPDFRKLRPSGIIGMGYGFVAAGLVILNLSYLVRRLIASSNRLGSMRVWLDLHVFTGLMAAVLVVFHSALQLRTPIAKTSAASLAVVVLTGLIGRFLYALTPPDASRLRLALDGLEAAAPGARLQATAILDGLPAPRLPANASLLRSLITIPRWRRVASQRTSALRVLEPPRAEATPDVRAAWRELHKASKAEARASGMAALLRSWRGLHRFFALLMLIAVGVHAGIAWHYGYRWIF